MADVAVFDSSAVLAVLLKEPGGASVSSILEGGFLSTVNLAEIHTRLLMHGFPSSVAWDEILTLQLVTSHFSDEQAKLAAELIGMTKPYGLSLGDRACLALAIQRRAIVYTTDKAWKNLALGIDIHVIR